MDKSSLSEKEHSDMTQEDRKAAHKAFIESYNHMKVRKDILYDELVEEIHAYGVKNFVPRGYSIAQAVAARASRMASMGMIICDGDGCSTQEQWKELVEETYRYLLESVICKPEILVGVGGTDEKVSEHEKKHGYHFLSYDMLGEPDWDKCKISYNVYAVEQYDPHGFLHELSLDEFYLTEDQKRTLQYISWDATDGGCKTSIQELYECTPDGIANRTINLRRNEQLDGKSYWDIHDAAGIAIAKSMIACEKIIESPGVPTVSDSKSVINEVYRHLKWFFGYYADMRNSALK